MLYTRNNERTKPAVMRIGSGKTNEYDEKTGTRVRIAGYASRVSKSLYEMLERNPEVKVMAMGEASVNNMVKAIAHANIEAQQDNKIIVGKNFRFENVMVDRNGNKVKVKAVSVILTTVDVDED